MRGRLGGLEIDFKTSIALALHEIGNVSASHRHNNLQVACPSLGGVNTEGDWFPHNSIHDIGNGDPAGIVGFDQKGAAFDMATR